MRSRGSRDRTGGRAGCHGFQVAKWSEQSEYRVFSVIQLNKSRDLNTGVLSQYLDF